MKHKAQPVLEICVETDPAGTVELDSEIGHVKMIPFKGHVNSALFTGIVEPCGVDAQVTDQNEVRHMSARYMLTGKDHTGAGCRIYVENNAWFTDGARPKPFRTVPTFITDSKALAPCSTETSSWGKACGTRAGCGSGSTSWRTRLTEEVAPWNTSSISCA